jgi:hypothetical protein
MSRTKIEYAEHVLTIVAGAWHRALDDRTLCRREVVEHEPSKTALDIPHCVRCYPYGHLGCTS